MQKGFSMLMSAPDERRVVKALLGSLGRGDCCIITVNSHLKCLCVLDESSIPELSIELAMLDKLKTRVQLARKIENTQHKIKKTNHDRKWMKETAETLGVDLDSDFIR